MISTKIDHSLDEYKEEWENFFIEGKLYKRILDQNEKIYMFYGWQSGIFAKSSVKFREMLFLFPNGTIKSWIALTMEPVDEIWKKM